ncbi:MAG TPA: D-Ala-D-Ala carboxypeptidase family metallohydrolase [Polyangiaceae bacterium]|jgi:uncharacterized protein YcbK (DUF882 family)|nr:D-Ala-D-Ala carboxypeptidase family metallohydrolase [Polyangiaceae bacterium]
MKWLRTGTSASAVWALLTFAVPLALAGMSTYPWGSLMSPSKSPGVLSLANQRRQDKPWFGQPMAGKKQLTTAAASTMRDLFVSLRGGQKADVSPELIELLVFLSDTFGGRQMCLVSGYRYPNDNRPGAKKSQHALGTAADIVILGIPNHLLAEYLLWLRDESDSPYRDKIGVGFYPNAYHVHVDVRGYPAYWVDLSGPTQNPQYLSGTLPRPTEAMDRYRDDRAPKTNFICQQSDLDKMRAAIGQDYFIPLEPEDQFLWNVADTTQRFRWKDIKLESNGQEAGDRWGGIDFSEP